MKTTAETLHDTIERLLESGKLGAAEAAAWHFWIHARYECASFRRSASGPDTGNAELHTLRRMVEAATPATPLSVAAARASR